MKLIFLSAITLLSVISAFAEPEVVIHSTHAEEDARAAAQERMEAQKIESAWFASLAQRALVPRDRATRGRYYDWLKENSKMNSRVQELTAVDGLSEGDSIRLDRVYDDHATIRMYLHDCGYNLSDAEITKVQTYMHANHIRHVSELGL